MAPQLSRTFSKLEAEKQRVLARLDAWPEDRLTRRPPNGGWSALEVIDHVIRTEAAVLAMMKGNRGAGNRATVTQRLRGLMVFAVMVLPVRVKVPPGLDRLHPSTANRTLADLTKEWSRCRIALAHFTGSLSGAELREGLAKHPYGGWINAHDTLQFLRVHLRHHTYQIGRLPQG